MITVSTDQIPGRYCVGMAGTVSPWMSGGAAVHPAELMKALSNRYAFKILTSTRNGGAARTQGSGLLAIRELPYATTAAMIVRGIGFLRDVDLLHIHDPRLFAIQRFIKKPMVTTIHGYLTREAAADYGTRPGLPRYELYKKIMQGCVRGSNALIAVDSRIASWLRSEFSASNVTTIPNGVDLGRFRPELGRSAQSREPFGLPPAGPLILAAKHFVAKNGLEYAIRAMPSILRRFPDAHLVLAGSGRLREKLVSIMAELGVETNVSMVGQVPNELMPDLIRACDVGIIPSVPVAGVEEATSILMLEVMASCKVVVASNIGGLRETIQNGTTGFLVPPGAPETLADAVVSVLLDPDVRIRVGAAARAFVERYHSWNSVALKTAEVYDRVLAA